MALLAGAIAAPVVGGILGSISASSGREAAANAAQAALAQLNQMGVPPDLSKQIILQQFQSKGVLTPELEQSINLQASQVGQIQEDPNLKNAQLQSLSTLGQLSRGGLSAGDRASFNDLQNQVQQQSQAKNAQILQQMQSQGMGGSGAQLLAQLNSSQNQTNQASSNADRVAATASQNALAALGQQAQLAGGIRSQDFNVNQAKAQALDQRNQFLYQNSASAQARNVQAQNAAQQQNLANSQSLANANTQQNNNEALRETNAKQQQWQDQLQLATAKANALNNQGSVLQNNAQGQANMYSGIGNAVGQGIGAYGAYANKQQASPTGYASADNSKPQKYDSDGNPVDYSF